MSFFFSLLFLSVKKKNGYPQDSPLLNEILHVLAKAKSSASELDQVSIIPARVWWVGHPPWPHVWAAHFLLPCFRSLVDGVYSKNRGTRVSLRFIHLGSLYGSAMDKCHSIINGKCFGGQKLWVAFSQF